jgi:hypothetical protein
VTCKQRQQKYRNELVQADQTQIPGAGRKVVHLPADGHQQHLIGVAPQKARGHQPDEIGLTGKFVQSE